MTVKRYEAESDPQDGPCSIWMEERPEGPYVTYSDYQKLAAENAALKNSSAFVMQDGEPPQKFYRNEWFIAKMKGHGFAVLKALPEDYSYDYTTLDATYFRKDLILGWMQLPSTEYLPNVETPATDAAIAEIKAQGVDELISDRQSEWMVSYCEDAADFAANLRAGRKG